MKFTDETIISALLSAGSIRKATEILGCSPTLIKRRLKDPDFKREYNNASHELLMSTILEMKTHLSEAVNTIANIMNDKTNASSVRLTAADCLLRHSLRYIETGDIEDRLDKLEEKTNDL